MTSSSQRTVLVVDDDDSARAMLGTTLELEGWVVRTAADGQEAIDALLERPPALVVIDMMMPRVAGFEVLQAMRDHPVLSDVPRIVCSARDSQMEQEVAADLGAARWLVKPVRPADLVAVADELVPS